MQSRLQLGEHRLERIDRFWIDGAVHAVRCNGVLEFDAAAGLIRASKDEDPWVRTVAVVRLGLISPRNREANTNPMAASCSSGGMWIRKRRSNSNGKKVMAIIMASL